MPYDKQIWTDRQVQNPMTFVLTNNADGTITLTPSPGAITSEGTLLLAGRMNHMEDGIGLVNDRIDKELKQITDCNDALETGIYWAPNGTTNNPSENNFIIQTFFKDNGNIMQLAYLANGDLNVFYKRYFTTTWSEWISNVKSAIRVGFDSVRYLQAANSNLVFDTTFSQSGDSFSRENGAIKVNKDMTALISANVWAETNIRVWFSVYSGSNTLQMIGQDASGYITLSSGGVFSLKKGDTIVMNSSTSSSVYLNGGSGQKQATSLSVVEI